MADNQNVSAEIAKLKNSHNRLVEQLGADSKAAKKAKMKLDAAEKKQASQSATAEAEEKATKPASKAKKAPKKSVKSSGDVRHVFEKKVEGGKEVKVIVASDETEAKGKLGDDSFTFVKVITRGRSPKEGFVADKKAPAKKAKSAPKSKSAPAKRASKKDRTEVAKEAGMTAERAKKESDKVATAKKRGRKIMDKDAYLFEMPLKTKAGKVKRKVIVATSEASAKKQAGGRYTLVKKLAKGENPKTGIQEVEGYVKPAPKKRGRKRKSASSSLPAVTKKAEAIGEGIAIADKVDDKGLQDILDSMSALNGEIGRLQTELAQIQGKVAMMMMGSQKKKVETPEVTEGLEDFEELDELVEEMKSEIALKKEKGAEAVANFEERKIAERLDKLSEDILRDELKEGPSSLVPLRAKFESIGKRLEVVVRNMMLKGLDEEDIKIIMIGVSLDKIQPIEDGGIDGEVFGNYYENKNAKGNEYTHTGLFWYVGDSFKDAYDTIDNNLDRGTLVIGFKYPHIDWDKALDDFDLKINPTPFLQLRRSDEDGQVYREAHIFNHIQKKDGNTTYIEGVIGKTMAYPSMQKGEEGKLNLSYELQSEVERLISLPPHEPYLDYEVELTYDGGYVGLVLNAVIAMRLFKEIVYGANMGIERSDGGEVYRNAYIKDFNVGFNFLGGIYEESKTNDVVVAATKEKIEELSQLFVK